MSVLAVTVLGHDRPGIIAGVTEVLAELGGNLEDSSMTLLRGHFAMTMIVSTDAAPDTVGTRVREVLAGSNLVVSVLELPAEDTAPRAGTEYLLSVHGADRPGIVSAVAGLLAANGGNVVDLTTRLAGSLYVLVAGVVVPREVDIVELDAKLAELARELGVEASLRPADTDVL